ncbi:ankyrin repeat-containing domain protein [Trametes polyzona]|nr:ankyrin repeat-containing domain protein [Trametes polyzona]
MAEKDASARLRRAVKENNLFLVKRLIKRTDMRNPDPYNKRYTSLAWAAVLGHEETFEFLLRTGHDDREYSKVRMCAPACPVAHPNWPGLPQDSENNTILILLAGARPPPSTPHTPGPPDQDFLGATLRMARMYIDRYPDILDWANTEGKTALHVAALKGNEELVRMLCDLGADFDLADNEGNTPLHYASAWGHITVVQLLIERGCQYSARNNQGFTPSDYAYSTSTRETLQDTARIQFENNKKARRNVFQQAASRGTDWAANASMQVYPPSPREYTYASSGSVRMRSGSGTSRTTTTSDSGDVYESVGQSSSRFWSSPSRRPAPLPSSTPISQPNSATLLPNSSSNPASALSPIATRMRERDADAMEKYKMRQRSGSATTASTDSPSQNESVSPPPPAPPPKDKDDISSLSSLVTVGSVAPRRRLRPSASAAQLRTSPQPLTIPSNSQEPRSRSGTSPAMLKPANGFSPSSNGDASALPTPTQNSTSRPSIGRAGSQPAVPEKDYTGPSIDYARFPPPPVVTEEPERVSTPTTATAPTHSRRLPFNLLSSHKNSLDQDVRGASHRRNASVNAVLR